MSITRNSSSEIPWWKEPSKEQWKAWIAAWLGWTLDAFDFTIFLLIMVPIAKEFDVSLTAVAAVGGHVLSGDCRLFWLSTQIHLLRLPPFACRFPSGRQFLFEQPASQGACHVSHT